MQTLNVQHHVESSFLGYIYYMTNFGNADGETLTGYFHFPRLLLKLLAHLYSLLKYCLNAAIFIAQFSACFTWAPLKKNNKTACFPVENNNPSVLP